MKITFSNLGTIKKTTLDLRPLTIIIGPNNTNKTYIAYSIYGIWQNLKNVYINFLDEIESFYEGNDTYSLIIDRNFTSNLKKYSVDFIEFFRKNLEVFFQDSSKKLFNKTIFEIDFTHEEVKGKIRKYFDFNNILETNNLTISQQDNPLKIIFNASKFWENKLNSSNDEDEIEIIYEVLENVVSLIFPQPFLLPAERNAFVITYKILAVKRLKHLRQIQREINSLWKGRQLDLVREQGEIRYPQPIEEFLDFLSDVEFEKDINRFSKEKTKYYEIANYIEKSIQKNNKTNLKTTKFGGKEIKINVKKGLDIDLYNASSSIKQLAPLLLYLRYRARENDLLIIDEPEMNLHPESQAKLLEVLGMLVNAGVNVLLTTHSPYFMSHLNNLVSGKMDNEKILKEQAKSLYLKDERAFLKLDDVSAYEMKNNKLVSLKDKDYGIRWDTLSDVSADIQQKFFEIYEKGEKPTNGKKE